MLAVRHGWVHIHTDGDVRAGFLALPHDFAPDAVLIDCAADQRHTAAHLTAMIVQPGAVILFDDAQRPQHAQTVRMLTEQYGEPEILRYDPEHDVPAAKERTTAVYHV